MDIDNNLISISDTEAENDTNNLDAEVILNFNNLSIDDKENLKNYILRNYKKNSGTENNESENNESENTELINNVSENTKLTNNESENINMNNIDDITNKFSSCSNGDTKNIDIIVGLQYGDEGKGKIVNYLAKTNNYDFCIRYNGGANAGHTIYNNGHKIVTHQIPSGLLHGIDSIIGDNCYLNVDKLLDECKMLISNGINIKGKLFISEKCHIITDEHLKYDGKDSIIGTTKSGIGPCATDKFRRNGIRICDIQKNNTLEQLLKMGINIINVSGKIYSYYLANLYYPSILVEGAQGFGLDINHGDYPYVTSSHCIASDCFNLGIPFRDYGYLNIRVIGIAKIYETYVGNKIFQPEDNLELKNIQEIGKEFGATTGRRRQCNYLNLNKLLESCFINQVDWLIINKCDILNHPDLQCFKLIYNQQLRTFNSFEAMRKFIRNYLDTLPYLNVTTNINFSSNPNDI